MILTPMCNAARGSVLVDVPVYLVIGRHEARGRVVPAQEWFDVLDAPAKQWSRSRAPASSGRPTTPGC